MTDNIFLWGTIPDTAIKQPQAEVRIVEYFDGTKEMTDPRFLELANMARLSPGGKEGGRVSPIVFGVKGDVLDSVIPKLDQFIRLKVRSANEVHS